MYNLITTIAMKHLLLFTAVLILTAASTFVKAQDTLPAGDNNVVPPHGDSHEPHQDSPGRFFA
jgi:hypothetical protein